MRRLAAVFAALALVASPCAGQSGFVARLSADTVEVGEVFSLLVRVPVPAGSVVHFPDTVARTDFLESHAPASWEAESDASGGAVLTLDYPVQAFGVALVPVPGFDIIVTSINGSPNGPALPGGSFIGAWADAPTTGPAYQRPLRVPRRGIWVNPVFTPEQIEAGAFPMPAADVLGASWHWPSALAALGFAALLALALGRIALGWRRGLPAEGARSGAAWTPETSRMHALTELARLREEGLAATGRMHELYTRSTGIVRTHVARVIPAYGTDLTSTELVNRLGDEDAVGPVAPAPSPTLLTAEMRTAEVVKFGRLRPATETADEHLSSLRSWLESWRSRP